MGNRIWITWENQRRNQTVSKAVGAKLLQFDIKLNRLMRYFFASAKTIFAIMSQKPTVIFAQNPSLVLSLLVVKYGNIFGIPVIIDEHNAGLFPLGGRRWWANKIALHILKNANLTIVTNENLQRYVEQRGKRSFILPDPIPEFKLNLTKKDLKGKYNILYICTYAADEPYDEVIKAARGLDKNICIYITGNTKGREKELLNMLSKNVVITGYLPENEYVNMLFAADMVMDLTKREDCLVCGAYEAVAAEKPMILSNTRALKEYFSKGALYVNNDAEDIVSKVNEGIKSLKKLKTEVIELKKERIIDWTKRREALEELIKDMENHM